MGNDMNLWDEIFPEIMEAYATQAPTRPDEPVSVWLPVPSHLMSPDQETDLISKLDEFDREQFVKLAAIMPVTGLLDNERNRIEFEDCTFVFAAFEPLNQIPWSEALKGYR